MKPEQQRIAIAEACGHINPRRTESGLFIASAHKNDGGKEWGTYGIPDYINDLNAMHEAERFLDYDQCEQYASDLWDIIMCAEESMENPPPSNFACIHATAAQRAEAFLKTLNLWTS